MKDRSAFLVIPAIFYLASLFLPAATATNEFTHEHSVHNGGTLLLFGWTGVMGGLLAWLANPVAALAMLFALGRRPARAIGWSLAALALSLQAFAWRNEPAWEGPHPVHLEVGAYLWMLSFAALLLCALLKTAARHRSEPPVPQSSGG
jgi:hypothetical protein